jgi:hypothetical protein
VYRDIIGGRSDGDVKNRWNSTMRRVFRNIYSTSARNRRKEAREGMYVYVCVCVC